MAEIDGNVSEMRRILLFLYQLFQMFHLSHLSRLSRMQQVCSFSRAVALFFLFLRNPGDSPEVHQRSFAALRMTKSQAVIPSLLSGQALSAAKGLARRTARSFATLRMTGLTPLKPAHGKSSLQMSVF
ncbi:MAG: hypothetical protein AUI01_12515 [Ktedonobacter sp. 13_2_20CM_2_56_8]|nr:MAG: hypothetical protein AUI01_12515 [Ktedonobacter sp. 13_2_20CM_2_56_8]